MPKYCIMLILILFTVGALYSVEYEWGLKYGYGVSSVFGDDARYNIRYDISSIGASTTDLGYLSLDSKWGKNGAAHNFGAYYTRFLVKQKDSVWLHSELIWQRYNITYNFSGRTINTDNLLLANAFADTLSGSIDTTVDYITIPVLIKLRQELAERPDRHYEGAFIYFGPAFSLAINSNTTKHKGISALDQNVSSFVAESYTDSDPSTVYSARERTSGTGKVLAHKTDFVLGLGFHIKDILELGLGRDEYVIDCRLTGGLYPIGDGDSKTEFKLRSVVLSLGVRI